jgi:hypothetical protein
VEVARRYCPISELIHHLLVESCYSLPTPQKYLFSISSLVTLSFGIDWNR